MKVGNIVQSKYTHSGREGNFGLVLELTNSEKKIDTCARVFYPKTSTSGWVKSKDMKVIA